jgi:DNA-binding transcriptional LysR family regulator
MEQLGFRYSIIWNSEALMHNRLELVRIFCTAAESTSFREAATRLGTSPQTVTRAIKELESQLGEPLFHRNTRQIQVTAFGESLAGQSRRALADFDQLFQRQAEAARMDIQGRVGITAPRAIGRRFLLSFLRPLLEEHPGLRVELRLDDQLTDSVEGQIDIGIRVGLVRDHGYVARPAADIPLYIVASPALLNGTGKPDGLEALARRPLSFLIDRKIGRPWPWLFAQREQFHPENVFFTCDDAEAELEAVLAGLVYGQLPGYLALPYLRDGRLIAVLPEYAPQPWTLFVYRPQQAPVSARVRLVYDRLVQCFADPTLFPQ